MCGQGAVAAVIPIFTPPQGSYMNNCLSFRILYIFTVVLCIIGAVVLTTTGCFKEEFDTGADARVSFSTDTLRFDTVFTQVGSATRAFRVHNPNDLAVTVSRVYVEQQSSRYRFNIDGLLGPEARDVEIRGRDSVWVFVEVTINPDDPVSESPFVIEHYMVFETNGNVQRVLLEAWGQNANYIPDRFQRNKISILTCDLATERWDDPKPYVLYGTLLIDSCTLVLPAGARLYVHGGIANNPLGVYNDGLMYTLPDGRLITEGTPEQPVIIQDDRLEEEYIGLWGGIQFGPGSGPHILSNTIIRHAAAAVVVDSAAELQMANCILHGTAGPGLFARHASVSATNCLFYDNGTSGVVLTYGGNYALDYCTIVNSGNTDPALTLTNFYCSDPLCQEGVFVNPLNALFRNGIIIGSSGDELVLSDAAPGQGAFDILFRNCIVQVRDLLNADQYPDFYETLCLNCIPYTFGDTLFADAGEDDFHLDSLSVAENQAMVLPGILSDLDGRMRDMQTPDIGCYEYFPN